MGPSSGRQLDFSGIDTVVAPDVASLPSTPGSASPDDEAADGKGATGDEGWPAAFEKTSPSTPELSPSSTGAGEDDDRPQTGNPSSGSGDRRWPYLSYTPSQHRRTPPSPPTPTFSPDASPAARPVDNLNSALTKEAKEVIDLLSSDDEGGEDRLPQAARGTSVGGPATAAYGGTASAAPLTGCPQQLPEQQQQQGAASVTPLEPTAPPVRTPATLCPPSPPTCLPPPHHC